MPEPRAGKTITSIRLGYSMFDAETTALLRSVLDEICEQVGKYENGTRTHVASRLLEAATQGGQTIADLKEAGLAALRTAPAASR